MTIIDVMTYDIIKYDVTKYNIMTYMTYMILNCFPKSEKNLVKLFEFGKNWKFDDPPPSDLILEKFEIRKILNFWNPPLEKTLA